MIATKELINTILDRFDQDYSTQMAAYVLETHSLALLYELATNGQTDLPRLSQEQLLFRSAYTLEAIYTLDKSWLDPYLDRFCTDFSAVQNESVKRHFTKIMQSVLRYHTPSLAQKQAMAMACAQWIVKPRVRVAVQIGAMELLLELSDQLEWVEELLPDIFSLLSRDPSPAMLVRLRRWRGMGRG